MAFQVPTPTVSAALQTITISPVGNIFRGEATITTSPWLIAVYVDLFIQGIVTTQLIRYFSTPTYIRANKPRSLASSLLPLHRPSSSSRSSILPNLKHLCLSLSKTDLWVLFTNISSYVVSVQYIAIVWNIDVRYWFNVDKVVQLEMSNWIVVTVPMTGAFVSILAMSFFILRLWRLSGNVYIILIITLICTTSFASTIAMVYYSYHGGEPSALRWAFPLTSGGALLLSGSLGYSVWSRRHELPSTMIARIGKTILLSASLPAIAAVVLVILCFTTPQKSSVMSIPGVLLNTTYVLSMMYSLNSRNEMRQVDDWAQQALYFEQGDPSIVRRIRSCTTVVTLERSSSLTQKDSNPPFDDNGFVGDWIPNLELDLGIRMDHERIVEKNKTRARGSTFSGSSCQKLAWDSSGVCTDPACEEVELMQFSCTKASQSEVTPGIDLFDREVGVYDTPFFPQLKLDTTLYGSKRPRPRSFPSFSASSFNP